MFDKIDSKFDANSVKQGLIEQRVGNIIHARMHIIITSDGTLTIRAERLSDNRKLVTEGTQLINHPFHFEKAEYWFTDTMKPVEGREQFILWSPESTEAPTKPFYSKTIARQVATDMSLRLNQKFFVCKLEESVHISRS